MNNINLNKLSIGNNFENTENKPSINKNDFINKKEDSVHYKKFMHCHCHFYTSILDGCMSVDDSIKLAKKYNHSAICITDHGSMAGTFEFYKKCKKAGIKPVIGIEAYVNDKMGDFEEKKFEGGNAHQIILVKNKQGYVNLNKLVYRSFSEGFYKRGRIKTEWLFENKEGLLVTTACMGSRVGKLLSENKTQEAEDYFRKFKQEFGEDFYAEIQLNELAIQKTYNSFIIEMAAKYNVKTILTNDIHYAHPEDAELQDTLLAINQKSKLGSSSRFNTRNLYYCSSEDFYNFNYQFGYNYRTDFIDLCLKNTLEIADKCNFDFEIGVEKYPKYEPSEDVIAYFGTSNVEEIGKKLAFQKLKQKLNKYKETGEVKITDDKIKEYVDRLNYELDVICSKKVLDYFLVNWEILRDYRKNGHDTGAARGCFIPNSRVKMSDGMFCPIESISKGDFIIDAFGVNRKVLNTFEYDVDEEILELEFENGVRIKCTKDHEFLTKNRGWVMAKDLDENDEVCEI